MLSSKEKKQAVHNLKELKSEVAALRAKLNEIDTVKEDFFEKREEISKEISKKIKENIALKQKRDEITNKVKEMKAERNTINEKLKALSTELTELDKRKAEFLKKNKVDVDPLEIKRQISRLEQKIETEAISFEAEKKTMKLIKDLKKKYSETKELTDIMDKKRKILDEVKVLRRKAKTLHQQVQDAAKESQSRHETMMTASKEIDGLKAKEAEMNEKFMQSKKTFSEINSQLKEKLGPMQELGQKLGEDYAELKAELKRKDEATLKKKEEEVQTKIRKGQKLTTEDLLVFQKMADDKQ